MESQHISAWINRGAADVYRYASDPANLPQWAAGLARSEVTRVGDTWVAQSPMGGEITIEFTPANDLGVLDHVVNLPSGEPVFNRCEWSRPEITGARWCSPCGADRR